VSTQCACAASVQQKAFRRPTRPCLARACGLAGDRPTIPVASLVASGDDDIRVQQAGELLSVPGAQFAGRIPEEVQSVGVEHADEAHALQRFLGSTQAQDTVRATGLDSSPRPERVCGRASHAQGRREAKRFPCENSKSPARRANAARGRFER
jgi:hypothetical protein